MDYIRASTGATSAPGQRSRNPWEAPVLNSPIRYSGCSGWCSNSRPSRVNARPTARPTPHELHDRLDGRGAEEEQPAMTHVQHREPTPGRDRGWPVSIWVRTVCAAALSGVLIALLVVVPAEAARMKVSKNCDPRSGRVIPVSQLQGPGPFAPGQSELMATRNANCKTAARLLRRMDTRCRQVSTQPAVCVGRFRAFGYRCRFSFDGGGGGTCTASRSRRVTVDEP